MAIIAMSTQQWIVQDLHGKITFGECDARATDRGSRAVSFVLFPFITLARVALCHPRSLAAHSLAALCLCVTFITLARALVRFPTPRSRTLNLTQLAHSNAHIRNAAAWFRIDDHSRPPTYSLTLALAFALAHFLTQGLVSIFTLTHVPTNQPPHLHHLS
jgi:hypothetical protein